MVTATEAFEQAKAIYDKRPHHQRWSFYHDKALRTQEYLKYTYGWKLQACTACSGSGRYDHNGSPKCSSCNGTGKERYQGDKAWPAGHSPKLV